MPWQPVYAHYMLEDGSNTTSDNCSDGIQWIIYKVLNDCVWDTQGITSDLLGLASILTWTFVTFPQMLKNFHRIQGIEGISFILILMWMLGDTCNLVGAVLTKQLLLQKYLAIYFVSADIMLFSQFTYYTLYWKKKHKGYEQLQSSNEASGVARDVDTSCVARDVETSGVARDVETSGVARVMLCLSGAVLLCIHRSIQPGESMQVIRHPAGRSLTSHNLHYHIHVFDNFEDDIGYAVGLVSSLFYTVSRVGQMLKNYKRKSTEGLSVVMFILAVIGNLTYGLAILVRQQDGNYIIKHLPWLIGSLGVIFLDASLLVQFKYYNDKKGGMDSIQKKTGHDTYSTDTEIYIAPDHAVSINNNQ